MSSLGKCANCGHGWGCHIGCANCGHGWGCHIGADGPCWHYSYVPEGGHWRLFDECECAQYLAPDGRR